MRKQVYNIPSNTSAYSTVLIQGEYAHAQLVVPAAASTPFDQPQAAMQAGSHAATHPTALHRTPVAHFHEVASCIILSLHADHHAWPNQP